MKYEFKTIGTDEFELHYDKKNADGSSEHKVIPFKRTIEMAKKLQNITAEARFNMFNYLNSIGKTKNDLIIERKTSDGKIEVDESNYKEFESTFLMEEYTKIANEIFEMTLGMDLPTILQELNITDSQDSQMFSTKLRMILTGSNEKNPSNEQLSAKNS